MTRNARLAAAALLATSALNMPFEAFAATPAPRFTTIDDHGVDMVLGLPYLTIDEGGVGQGPGAVRLQRIYAAGAGWTDNWSGGLYTATIGGVTKTYVQIAGISDTFTEANGVYTSENQQGSTLVPVTGGLLYTAADGTTIQFSTSNPGMIPASCPAAAPGNCQIPLVITKPNGLAFSLFWDSWRKCLSQPAGEICGSQQVYKRLGKVTSSAGFVLNFNYQSDAPAGTVYQPDDPPASWSIRSSVSFTGGSVHYDYPLATETRVTDAENRTWVLTTDSSNRLIGVRRPGSASDDIAYVYGVSGKISSATKDGVNFDYASPLANQYRSTDPLGHQTLVTIDQTHGRPASVKDAAGDTVSFQYDANGRVQRITQPEGNYTSYTYDARGNVEAITTVAKGGTATIATSANYPDSCANPVTCNKPEWSADAKGNVTNYEYDSTHGGVTKVTQPAPATGAARPQTRYEYVQVDGAATGAVFGPVYLLDSVKACATGATCTTADEIRQKATYAAGGNLLPVSIRRGNTSGTVSSISTIAYDARGNVDTIDGPLAGAADTTKYVHDNVDQLIGVISPDPDGSSALPHRAVRTTYRPDGQVDKRDLGTVTTQSAAALTNMNALQTVDLIYDGNSRVTSQKLMAGSTVHALTQMSYDADGRLDCSAIRMTLTTTQPACTPGTAGASGPDQITKFGYDEVDRVTSRTIGIGTPAQAVERALTYSANGQVATLTDGENNRTTYEYDGFDRLSKTRYPVAAKGANASSTSDYEQLLNYDANGNPGTRRLRDGTSIAYTYDNLNRVKTKNLPGTEPDVTYGWDNLGRLTAATQTGNALSFGYDVLSRMESQTGPQGTVTSGYDAAGRRILLTYPAGGTALSVNYDYLVTGEIDKIRENDAAGGIGVLADYSYDVLGNMTAKAFGNGVSQAYTFDAVSRLKSLTNDLAGTGSDLTVGDATNPISYNPAGQITSIVRTGEAYPFTGFSDVDRNYVANGLNQYASSTDGGVTSSFSYDARGNLTSDGSSSFTYSSENLLKTGPNNSTLAYDSMLRLYELGSGSAKIRFGYDGLNMIGEYDGVDALQRRHVFGPGLDQPIVTYEGSGLTDRRFLSTDERGSIISISDNGGAALSTNGYDEYGVPQSPASASAGSAGVGSLNGRFGFTGQAWLPEIGLYYYKARMYSPGIGRFLQTDPIGCEDGSNWYAYAKNEPVDFVDPTGTIAPLLAPGAIGFGVGVVGRVTYEYATTGKIDLSGRNFLDILQYGVAGAFAAYAPMTGGIAAELVTGASVGALVGGTTTSIHSLLLPDGRDPQILTAMGYGAVGGVLAVGFNNFISVAQGYALSGYSNGSFGFSDSAGNWFTVATANSALASEFFAGTAADTVITIIVYDSNGNAHQVTLSREEAEKKQKKKK